MVCGMGTNAAAWPSNGRQCIRGLARRGDVARQAFHISQVQAASAVFIMYSGDLVNAINTNRLNFCSDGQRKTEDPYGFVIKTLLKHTKPPSITKLVGNEVIGSSGVPTVEVDVHANVYGLDKCVGTQAAPSSSSSSSASKEIRDSEEKRLGGTGCVTAVNHVSGTLSQAVQGILLSDQAAVDHALCNADGTEEKSSVGVNAICAASMAVAVGAASTMETPLYAHLASIHDTQDRPQARLYTMPVPVVTMISGGADHPLPFTSLSIVPAKKASFAETMDVTGEVFLALGSVLAEKFGAPGRAVSRAGGYMPPVEKVEDAIKLIEQAVSNAGLSIPDHCTIGVHAGANAWYNAEDKTYDMTGAGLKPVKAAKKKAKGKSTDDVVGYFAKLCSDFPSVRLLEDPLADADTSAWSTLTEKLSAGSTAGVVVVGDSVLSCSKQRVKQCVQEQWCKGLHAKISHVGTITETIEAVREMQEAKGGVVVVGSTPHDSSSTLIADLAVAVGARHVFFGARGDAAGAAKYNRCMRIERELSTAGLLAPTTASADESPAADS